MRSAPRCLLTMLNWILCYTSANPHHSPPPRPRAHVRILVNHIRDSPPLLYHLAPSVPVKVLAAQLTAADVPRAAVSIRRIGEQRWHLLSGLQALLQPEQMSVHAVPV